LPTKWTRRVGLKAGDELELEEKGNSIIINAAPRKKPMKFSFDSNGIDFFLMKRYLNNFYKVGIDELELRFSDPSVFLNIQRILHTDMIGYEIISQGEHYCIIKSLSLTDGMEFDSSLRRCFLLLKSLGEETYNAISSGNLDYLKNASMLEQNNNRLTTFCRRVLNKVGYKDEKKVTFIYLVIEELEKIADEYKYIASIFEKNKRIKNISPVTLSFYKKTNEFVDFLYRLFYNYSKERSIRFTNEYRSLINEAYSIMSRKGGYDTLILHHLSSILRICFDLLAPILALHLF